MPSPTSTRVSLEAGSKSLDRVGVLSSGTSVLSAWILEGVIPFRRNCELFLNHISTLFATGERPGQRPTIALIRKNHIRLSSSAKNLKSALPRQIFGLI